ncbi:urease accessory UreF family protein [Crocosphaera sp. UHCC 0190]|uniref:urease accessory protein UreF n=1 Tax=Crocosphaera sp. UHCC 0190 TaxID=3110246 RepID=UPI002B220BFE|nr:urease accessory UreF family protein [Crocosphaera sp. UHCC 0190]MEA5509191.1 urease accessory UreF family protein [Crocosphaera sp. UHCC 0190]
MINPKISPLTISQKLALMQLSDSFFPSGSFTLSHGLETLVQTEQIQNPQDLLIFLRLLLNNKVGPTDGVALIHAYRGSANNNLEAIKQSDTCLFAQTLIEKTREIGRKSGRALLMIAAETWHDPQLSILSQEVSQGHIYGFHCVIFGVVGRVAGLNEEDTLLAFFHGLVTGLLGAAIRLSIIGHRQAQQILQQLVPDLEAIYQISTTLTLAQMWSCTPAIDLAQMGHQKLSRRLFAN